MTRRGRWVLAALVVAMVVVAVLAGATRYDLAAAITFAVLGFGSWVVVEATAYMPSAFEQCPTGCGCRGKS